MNDNSVQVGFPMKGGDRTKATFLSQQSEKGLRLSQDRLNTQYLINLNTHALPTTGKVSKKTIGVLNLFIITIYGSLAQ